MSGSATEWAWANSRASNGSLTVLLAIADEIDRKGPEVEMSVAQIAGKSRLGDKATRDAVKALARLGELSVTPRQGGISRYAMPLTSADITGVPRQILPGGRICTPAESTGPVDNPPEEPQVRGTPAESTGPAMSDVLDLGSVVSGGKSRSKDTPAPPREDVERLCAHLAGLIAANGSKRPNIDKRWRDSARRMIDIDGRAEDKAHLLIDWCQQDDFWHRNILSMPTFRRQYDKLRLAAIAEWEKKKRPARNGHQPTQDDFAALRDNWARPLDAMEAANDPRRDGEPGPVRGRSLPAAEDWPGDNHPLV